MNVYISYLLLLLSLTSCKTYEMLDGKSKPVKITPDASVFDDSTPQEQLVSYQDLLSIRGNMPNVVILHKNKTSRAIISQPTFLYIYDEFLVYPREHIVIKKGDYNNFIATKFHGGRRRNRELNFFTTFSKLKLYPDIPMAPSSLDAILNSEKKLKAEIPVFEIRNRQIFDSLLTAYRVHKKFKKIAKEYIQNEEYAGLFDFYKQNKDTLQAYNLYKQKCERLISSFIGKNKLQLQGGYIYFNELSNAILPYPANRVKEIAEFQSCFDSVDIKFNGLARDYLLSQLMYSAYKNKIQIDTLYEKRYQNICSDKDYKALIYKIQNQQNKDDEYSMSSDGNLMAADGKIKDFKDILSVYKGKIVVVDFWATWCIPCRKELPYLDSLLHLYPSGEIASLSLSVEKEIQPWQKFVLSNDRIFNSEKNFLLVNADESALVNRYKINEIPRFMVINKDGDIIIDNAPSPSNPELKEILDSLIR